MKAPPPKKPADKRNKVCTAVGKNLKAIRIEANKSQETLAFDADVDRTYVSQIERGAANPSVITLANLCYALNITLADLFAPVTIALSPAGPERKPPPKPIKTRLR
ncbi:helix-turn-helix protein [Collimonas sp. PA-H2]|uniref:helix-turn-helix domain-containing protein n=1 Tax=Collimonas sp. PA-H2 TaxID=1881062 RepID=UPI000BF3475C|nr:helix-turn-helix transcriptional regulator [Collimonas sp. PA-H2]PFH10917.1 helix-turn-helix protein [Collimonas sp. PA-H2]